jgi:hypothetical protein
LGYRLRKLARVAASEGKVAGIISVAADSVELCGFLEAERIALPVIFPDLAVQGNIARLRDPWFVQVDGDSVLAMQLLSHTSSELEVEERPNVPY